MASKITARVQDVIPRRSPLEPLEARAREIAERFGYGEIRTPTFEATELFVRGVGETTDIVEKEMYTFTDKGGRSITLRPEWTAPVVRAALEHNLFEAGSQRLFYIGPIYRYERPQKGRLRQAHQFGVECVGFKGPEADVEVLALAWSLVRSYGIADAVLSLNSIGDAVCRPRYRDALLARFRHACDRARTRRRVWAQSLARTGFKAEADRALIETAPTASRSCATTVALRCGQGYLDALSIRIWSRSRIVRGLDYYTRTVFRILRRPRRAVDRVRWRALRRPG